MKDFWLPKSEAFEAIAKMHREVELDWNFLDIVTAGEHRHREANLIGVLKILSKNMLVVPKHYGFSTPYETDLCRQNMGNNV